MKANPHAKAALLQAVQDQLKSAKSIEVQHEYQRLVALGIGDSDAREMIATILSFHMVSSLQRGKEFDYPAYLTELRRLPDVDYDKEL